AGCRRVQLECEQPMTLEVAKRAVVGEDVEAVRRTLEGASGAMAPVAALAGAGGEHGGALVGGHPPRRGQELRIAELGNGVERRGRDLDLALGVEVRELDLVDRCRLDGAEPSADSFERRPRLRQIPSPGGAALRLGAPRPG